MVHIRSRFAMFVLALGAISLIGSCVSTQKAPEPAFEPPPAKTMEPAASEPEQGTKPADTEIFFTHTVKWTGESLSIIAAWYTGELENWKLLAEANPELNPNLIRIGDEIRIPEGVMVTSETLPFDFVAKYVPSLKRGRTASPAPAPEKKQESEGTPGDIGEAAPVAGETDVEAGEVSPPVDEAGQAETSGAEGSGTVGAEPEDKPEVDQQPVLFGPKSFD